MAVFRVRLGGPVHHALLDACHDQIGMTPEFEAWGRKALDLGDPAQNLQHADEHVGRSHGVLSDQVEHGIAQVRVAVTG